MSAISLEERVAALEKELSELKRKVGAIPTKDWRKSFGMSADDTGFDEMVQLGAEIRRSLDDDESDA